MYVCGDASKKEMVCHVFFAFLCSVDVLFAYILHGNSMRDTRRVDPCFAYMFA